MKSANALRTEFLVHQCTDVCLILKSEAAMAGLSPNPLSPSEPRERALILDLRSESKSKKRKALSLFGNTNKVPRLSFEASAPDIHFPFVLSQSEKDQIVREFREATNNASLKQYACSLCGTFENVDRIKMKSVDKLDISHKKREMPLFLKVHLPPRRGPIPCHVEMFNSAPSLRRGDYGSS